MNKELIRKTVQKEIINGIKKELDGALIFTYIHSLEQENKELHNKIDKAIRYIKKNKHYIDIEDMNVYLYEDDIKKVLEILKESDVDDNR